MTLVEWADLQCPYCRQWTVDAFPTLVRDYVRPGKLQIVFSGLAFLGPDSSRTLRVALAAGLQNRLWNVVDAFYRLQGVENSGWASDAFLRDVVASVPGLDSARLFAEANSDAVGQAMTHTAQEGDRAKVTGTPTFDLGSTGAKTFERFNPRDLSATSFTAAIDKLLGG